MRNGDGMRAVLWVSGCNHHCKNCQNPVTWNPDDGIEFDSKSEQELYSYIDPDYCSGLTLSGGDPMFPKNRGTILELCKRFRERYGDTKSIWMYTGYQFEDIKDEPVLRYVDVVVDGEFMEKLKDVHYMWAGSTNQRIWKRNGAEWTLLEKQWDKTLSEINSSCGCG
jgi:anaerobic ribonucleoside-triphosphate reductase activating protein